ncbi:hypothetical protein [Butyrivibrio sp. WCD2001]|uniref:hypothetical protein n=1 Tax=Butyrivibrio sp. WCD2001 TaxID=1280681 RepID=UPI00041AEAF1|nr:hypothetical protein [Butyrivibrio sp. WCD2001]
MKNDSEIRVCKNKKCKKILPEGYKHRYCEACRNKHAQIAKNVVKGATAFAGVAVLVISGGKIDLKK